MHKTLERQLKKHFGSLDRIPKDLQSLFETISRTYTSADEDRELVTRSLELSSQELFEINARLLGEKEELERLNGIMVGRELKMVELKKEIERLRQQLGTS